jgi:regulatory protein
MSYQKKYTNQEAISKLQKYCAYQDRCHQEINIKLYEWGFPKDDRDEIIVKLIEDNFLNEERFARSFTRGKFKIKKWGKQKIKYQLKQKGIGDKLIEIAQEEIEEGEYFTVLEDLIKKKYKSINDNNKFSKQNKVVNYMFSRGFEPELVWKYINKLKF